MSPRPLRPAAPLSKRSTAAALLTCVTLATMVACGEDTTVSPEPSPSRVYGAPMTVGNGQARTYVVKANGKPVEFGVAFSESAMDGLPGAPAADPHAAHGAPGAHTAPSHETAHMQANEYLLALPTGHDTQYKLVEVNWNPAGHEPAGIYDLPHFDFHFYNITKAERDQIDPTNPSYVQRARNAPDAMFARQFFVNQAVALNAPAEALAVPRMGLHWIDAKAPELQGLVGNPAGFRPFTATYIQGAWNGTFIFEEPMITRAHIVAKKSATTDAERDQLIPLTSAQRANPAGYYPSAYRITYDPAAKEYRIALAGLTYRE